MDQMNLKQQHATLLNKLNRLLGEVDEVNSDLVKLEQLLFKAVQDSKTDADGEQAAA